jgi:O-succinylhomoserine sulfhydrylase
MITKFNTKAIREGYQATNEQEHSEAIFLTSSFKFDPQVRLIFFQKHPP